MDLRQTFFDDDLDPVRSYLGGDPSAGVDSMSCVWAEWPMVVCGGFIDLDRTL